MQVIGVGSDDDFDYAQRFLSSTKVGAEDSPMTMLWEGSGNLWSLNNVSRNSAIQLFSYDLSKRSSQLWFNDRGRSVILDAVIQEPWAPAGSPNLIGANSSG